MAVEARITLGSRERAFNMNKGLLTESVRRTVDELVQAEGLQLFEFKVARVKQNWFVSVVIERHPGAGPVSHKDCVTVNRMVKPVLAEVLGGKAPPIEVSSPGLNRPLRGIDDFKRFLGKRVQMTYGPPSKNLVGIIEKVTDSEVVIRTKKTACRVDIENISAARLVIDPFTDGHWNE